jgi:succinoglycan biosynthesis transport protein ExoP
VSRRPPLLSDALRRRWLLVAAVIAFCILAALAYGQVRRSSYEADTSVVVYPVAGATFSQQQTGTALLDDLSTEAQVVRSDDVARLAQQLLTAKGYDKLTVGGLISRVSATVQTNTQVLRITYQAGTPRRARDGADAFATAYLSNREANAKAAAQADMASLEAKRKDLQQALRLNGQQLDAATPGSPQGFRLSAQITADDGSLADVTQQESDLTKRPVLPGEVLSPATLPSKPHGISAPILGGFGLLFGLLLGTIVAVARERMVGTIRRAESLPEFPPTLAVIPSVRATEPVMLTSPSSRAGEAYRLLYLAVDAALPPTRERGAVIAVATLSDVTPPAAVNLAAAAAAAGRVSTYVEALPRQRAPRLSGLHANPSTRGFAEAVLEGIDPVAARVSVSSGLTTLMSGGDLGRATESYGGPRTHRVFEALRRAAELVVVAIPPLTEPDGQALANVADGVVLVTAIGDATFTQLDESLVEAARVHARVLGVVAVYPTNGRGSARGQAGRGQPKVVADEQQPAAPATWVPS